MILYPAIDLKDGQCVRLKRGVLSEATVFNDDPAAQARSFEQCGFQWIHCVDLNGAFAGYSANSDAIKEILKMVSLPVQLGGGIRDRASIENWLSLGVARIVLGTAAVRDPDLVREAARVFPGRVAVGIDAREGLVAVSGWAETSSFRAEELARRFEDAGVAAIIFTDIGRDGMLTGINIEATASLARSVSIPVIASGGAKDVSDIQLLVKSKLEIAGVILGRALYDGRIRPDEALRVAAGY